MALKDSLLAIFDFLAAVVQFQARPNFEEFYLTLLQNLFSPNSRTYFSVEVLYFAGPPSCPFNKGYSQSDVRDLRAYLGHVHPDEGQL